MPRNPSISAAQCRGARAMLGWSREELADASSVHLRTIVDFEREARSPRAATFEALEAAFNRAGISFFTESGNVEGIQIRLAPEVPGLTESKSSR